jgi:hypothetical protein
MHISSGWLLGALQIYTFLGQTLGDASPDNKGMVVEFRVKKPAAVKRASDLSLGVVRDAAILVDGGVSDMLNIRSSGDSTLGRMEKAINNYHQKRQTTGDSTNKNGDSCKKKVTCTYGRVWNEEKQNCEDCPSGQEANKDGDKCVPKQTDEEKKKQGKCADGQVLDPSVSGQVSRVAN